MNTKTEKKKDMGRIAKNTIVVVFSAIFFAFTGKVSAGDYRIYFTGTGDTNIVDSVRVQNLAQGTKLTLKGTEVLHLVSEVKGIKTVNTPTGELKVYPNPARETINVDFPATGSGPVQIDILGLSGIILAQKTLQVQEAGTHRAMITDLSKGSYLLKVS